MPDNTLLPVSFESLSLIEPVLRALNEVGYESPSPIQQLTIPHLLAGKDILGQAQTGTGKTAAFALPLLSQIDTSIRQPQVLVLAPTRELAIQVSEAFQRYAMYIKDFHVLPVYGGQDYSVQLKQLKRGVHVVVGTPGRVMDHMRRGTLKLDMLKTLVLDEADEMLRMGFIDDVEWILEQSPAKRQVALFSATLPPQIQRIAKKHLHQPEEIFIKVRTSTAESIHQRYWLVSGLHKLDALTRILEGESFEAIIIFVRTKLATTELAEKLAARGYAVAPLNGDIQQKQRERTIEKLKNGNLDIIVATDVAARGLDVDRISHVINYDVPHDTESYVHRIGRTGRFGKKGEAILFIAPRERNMLYAIEKATRQKIELMQLPSTEMLNNKRTNQFFQRITDTLAGADLELYQQLIERYQLEHNVPALDIAAALAKQSQGDTPLLLHSKEPANERNKPKPSRNKQEHRAHDVTDKAQHRERRPAPGSRHTKDHAADSRPKRPAQTSPDNRPDKRSVSSRPKSGMEHAPDRQPERPAQTFPDSRPEKRPVSSRPKSGMEHAPDRQPKRPAQTFPDSRPEKRPVSPRPKSGMERFRLDVGKAHGVKPGNIVGTIIHEAGLASSHIDQITIYDDYSTVDLPKGMPREIFRELKKAQVAGRPMNIARADSGSKRAKKPK